MSTSEVASVSSIHDSGEVSATEGRIHEIENKMLQGILGCRSSEAVEAAITYARFLSSSGITPENYPVFLQMLEIENHWVIDALIGERDPFLLLSPVQPNSFIVNRLLVPYLLDAIRAFHEGVGSIEDIDRGMKMGCGHPMGPFTLLDFVGIDTTYFIANIMFEDFRETRFAPPPLMKRMVLAGFHGRKSGNGFYDYSKERPVANDRILKGGVS